MIKRSRSYWHGYWWYRNLGRSTRSYHFSASILNIIICDIVLTHKQLNNMNRLKLAWNGAFKKEVGTAPSPTGWIAPPPVSARPNYVSDLNYPLQRKRSSSMSDIAGILTKEQPLSRKLSRKMSRTTDTTKRMSINILGAGSTKNYTSLALAAAQDTTDDSDTSNVSEIEDVVNDSLSITEKLHMACIRGKLNDMIEILNEYQEDNPSMHIDFNAQFLDKTCNGCALLHRAAKYQRIDIMNYLWERGASVDVQDVLHATPLFYAVSSGSVRASSFLLSKRASVNVRDKFECSPAWAALKNGHLEIVRLLLLFNADIHYKVRQGQTLLHLACEVCLLFFFAFCNSTE
jgi:hypothetical protein